MVPVTLTSERWLAQERLGLILWEVSLISGCLLVVRPFSLLKSSF